MAMDLQILNLKLGDAKGVEQAYENQVFTASVSNF
jgi:hypothetical protein